MPVDTLHPEYSTAQDKWELTQDAASGMDVNRGKKYIIKRSHEETSEHEARIKKAIYTNYTGRTRDGLSGAVFREKPQIELPDALEFMRGDADGAGQNLVQLSKQVFGRVCETGRYGLLADYPQADTSRTTRADQMAMRLRPSICCYQPGAIINWKTKTIGGQQVLAMVVLQEKIAASSDDAFSHDTETQYRVLALDEAHRYYQQIYDKDKLPVGSPSYPRMAGGGAFDHIPFWFVGSRDNLPGVDTPLLYDIAVVNIGHYRNSADWENNLSVHSGATLVLATSQDSTEFNDLNKSGITVGENRGIILSEGGRAELLQLDSAQAIMDEMERKEQRMVQIGAKIITKGGQIETAEGERIAATSEHSVLDTVVGNISDAFTKVLQDCALFVSGANGEIDFQLNTDYWFNALSPQEAMALVQLNDAGMLRKESIVKRLQEAGIEDSEISPEEILAKIADEPPIMGATGEQ